MDKGEDDQTFMPEGPRNLSRRLTFATLANLVAVALILVGGLVWATQGSDEISVERQIKLARHSINTALDSLALQQQPVAIWDDSYEHMTAKKKDVPWLEANLSNWLNYMYQHDVGMLIDAKGETVNYAIEGASVPLQYATSVRKDVQPLIDAVNDVGDPKPGLHDRLLGQSPVPGNALQTNPAAVHATRFMLVAGRPAAASAMLIVPSSKGAVGKHGNWPVLVSVRYLDSVLMKELESRYLINEPRFSRVNDHVAGETAQRLDTESGDLLGYLIWKPELPGSKILSKLGPANILALILLSALMLLLTHHLKRALAERSRLQEKATRLAYHDALTGLPNRRLLVEQLERSLALARSGADTALLLLDIDRFKQVNDLLGHLAGDELIRQFADRLTHSCGPEVVVARLGGDEFAVIVTGVVGEVEVEVRLERMLALFARPFQLFDQEVQSGASIGASLAGGSGITAIEMMRRADVALYQAKGDGRSCARLFHEHMDRAAQERSQLAADMRRALANSEFTISAQPQVGRDGVVIGNEVLLRWEHPALGTVAPNRIIPIAEESGLIGDIGLWVLRQAIGVAKVSPGLFTAVNLSPVQLRDTSFARNVVDLFDAEGVDPSSFELEITEQTLLDDSNAIKESLALLRDSGFHIALDDFGTGYSSLSFLRQFSVDKIKIDRSFVAEADAEHTQAIIVAIVALGRALGLKVAAEGVETKLQAAVLLAAGVDQFQGHYYSPPVPIARISEPGDEAPAKVA